LQASGSPKTEAEAAALRARKPGQQALMLMQGCRRQSVPTGSHCCHFVASVATCAAHNQHTCIVLAVQLPALQAQLQPKTRQLKQRGWGAAAAAWVCCAAVGVDEPAGLYLGQRVADWRALGRQHQLVCELTAAGAAEVLPVLGAQVGGDAQAGDGLLLAAE